MISDRQEVIIDKLNLKEINLLDIIYKLKAKNTQSANIVLQRVLGQQNGTYKIFSNNTQFTVTSEYLITKIEQSELAVILGLEYVVLSNLLTRNECWVEWLINTSKEEE